MTILEVLESRREEIEAEAVERLACRRLSHYRREGPENLQRMHLLLDAVLRSVRTQTLVPVVEHMDAVAAERFAAGFGIHEVQAACNALEEVLWKRITLLLPAESYPDAFGLVGSLLGAAKEALASRYVALASRRNAPPVDVDALFSGT